MPVCAGKKNYYAQREKEKNFTPSDESEGRPRWGKMGSLLRPRNFCVFFIKMNSGARDAAQTGHKRQATKTGRHVVTQGSLGDGGVLRRRGEPELGRNLFRRRELQRD